jgi:hypothetical protein
MVACVTVRLPPVEGRGWLALPGWAWVTTTTQTSNGHTCYHPLGGVSGKTSRLCILRLTKGRCFSEALRGDSVDSRV